MWLIVGQLPIEAGWCHAPLALWSFSRKKKARPFDQNLGSPLIFFFIICTWPFGKNVWSSFIYSFLSVRPFHQKLESSLIYLIYMHTTIRPKQMIFFYLFFLLYTTIWPKHRILIDLFVLFEQDHSTKICDPCSVNLCFAHDHSTNNLVPRWFISFIFTRPFDQNIWSSFIYSSLYATFPSKLRILISLFLLFVQDHSTKVRGHSYSLIYFFLNWANISFAIFMAVLPLYFVRSISCCTAFIFRPLYS